MSIRNLVRRALKLIKKNPGKDIYDEPMISDDNTMDSAPTTKHQIILEKNFKIEEDLSKEYKFNQELHKYYLFMNFVAADKSVTNYQSYDHHISIFYRHLIKSKCLLSDLYNDSTSYKNSDDENIVEKVKIEKFYKK